MTMSPPIVLAVPPLGGFVVKRMNPRLRMAIELAAERMGIGDDGQRVQGELLKRAIHVTAFLENLIVEAPPSFDLATLDPADPECMAKMLIVEDAILAEDARFRGRPWPPREADGARAEPDHGVPVPQDLRPATD